MLTFKWSITPNGKCIEWDATWDGKHDSAWYDATDLGCGIPHPFCRTVDFEQDLRLWELTQAKKAAGEVDCYEFENPSELREIGDFVANNPVTRAMCEMLSDMDTIHEHSGMTDRYWYWFNLLGALSLLWD